MTGRVDFTEPMTGFLGKIALTAGYPWYAAFVRGVVLPHASLFASLVIAGESVVAISLLFGVATRLGALLAIVLLLNYASAKGTAWWSPGSNDVPDMILALLVCIGAAGRFFGIDKQLHERFPRVPLW